MTVRPLPLVRRAVCRALLPLLLVVALAGCDTQGLTLVDPPADQDVAVVVNSVDVSLSVFPVDSPQAVRAPIGLGADGSPVGVAVRGGVAVVPLGLVPALAVVDLVAGELTRTVALPDNSGATGSAFLDDRRVLVANPNLNTVSPVDLATGTAGAQIAVGTYPQHVAVVGDRVLVLNARLGPDFLPQGPGTVTVLDRQTLEVLGTVQLSGLNPGGAAVAGNRAWILNSGTFGGGNGSLSLVDPFALDEVAHHTGFGEFPGGVAVGPTGRVAVSSFSYGVAVWNPTTGTFVRPPSNAIEPGGIPSAAGAGFDGLGRLWTLEPECASPGTAFLLDDAFGVTATAAVGTCPIAVGFTSLEP